MDRSDQFTTLAQWLAWQESLHTQEIDLGLERVSEVYSRLDAVLSCPIVTVAGTNGKGSCLHYLDHLFRQHGQRTGLYTSPHLTCYNERIRIDGEPVDDENLMRAFAAIDEARAGIPLTYFEFSTLAALILFAHSRVDICLLEVGLGGRLDAVNIVDAQVAIITSIDLDHQSWLGDDRETIGREKAGICRRGKAVFCGDKNPPDSIAQAAEQTGAILKQIDIDFGFTQTQLGWDFWDEYGGVDSLPALRMRGRVQLSNAACAIAAFRQVNATDSDGPEFFSSLSCVQVPGRVQHIPGPVSVTLDVAHNPAAVQVLAESLLESSHQRIYAVVGMLSDKDVRATLKPLAHHVDYWYIAGIQHHRGLDQQVLRGLVSEVSEAPTQTYANAADAYVAAKAEASQLDHIVVFGSFHTVGAVLEHGI